MCFLCKEENMHNLSDPEVIYELSSLLQFALKFLPVHSLVSLEVNISFHYVKYL